MEVVVVLEGKISPPHVPTSNLLPLRLKKIFSTTNARLLITWTKFE